MTIKKKGAVAGHLEDLAYKMTEIDTRPNDGSLLGMKQKVAEAIDHLLRAMFWISALSWSWMIMKRPRKR